MAAFVLNKIDPTYAEITTNGVKYNFDDRKGKWSIWNISLFLDGVEEFVQKRENFLDLRTIKRSGNVSFVIIKQVMKLNPAVFNFSYVSDVSFRIIKELCEPGRTSIALTSRLLNAKTGELYVERFYKVVVIDNASRRPTKNPEWYINKYANLKVVPPELNKSHIPNPPAEVFEYRTVVRLSDLDVNLHASHSLYIKSCMDCAAEASLDRKLEYFTGDISLYPVLFISVDYLGECFAGDEIVVVLWQHKDRVSAFSAIIYKAKASNRLTYINFELGLDKMTLNSLV